MLVWGHLNTQLKEMLAIAGIVFFLRPTAKLPWHAKRHMQKMFMTESPEEHTAEFFYPGTSTHQDDVEGQVCCVFS